MLLAGAGGAISIEVKQAMRMRETVCSVQFNVLPLLSSDYCSDATKVSQQFSFFSYAIVWACVDQGCCALLARASSLKCVPSVGVIRCHLLPQKSWLLQLGEFDFGLLQDREIRVRVLPKPQEFLIRGFSLHCVAFERACPGEAKISQSSDAFVQNGSAVVQNFSAYELLPPALSVLSETCSHRT